MCRFFAALAMGVGLLRADEPCAFSVDNVGDNVGDIAGMGADLFGSFAESTCAALVISSVSSLGQDHLYVAMSFPLMISAVGICVCFLTTFVATDIRPARIVSEIENTLKYQLIISTILATPVSFAHKRRSTGLAVACLACLAKCRKDVLALLKGRVEEMSDFMPLAAAQAVFVISWFGLPKEFTGIFSSDPLRVVKNWYLFICVAVGLWGGLIIGIATEYFTSNRYQPVQVCPIWQALINSLVSCIQCDSLIAWCNSLIVAIGVLYLTFLKASIAQIGPSLPSTL